jgi:hypothetical protein
LVAILTACKDDMYDNSPDEPLRLSVEQILVNFDEHSVTIGVTARDVGWSVTGVEPWYTVTPTSGDKGISQVTVTLASNDPETIPDATTRTATLTFISGGAQKSVSIEQLALDQIPLPHENEDAAANKEIFKEIEEWYFNSEPTEVPEDTNQFYDDFFFNYLSHLKRNEGWDGGTWAMGNDRFIYSRVERNPAGTAAAAATASSPPPNLNYGMEFEMIDFSGIFAARILYVEPGSPAATAGLKRGDWFREVNDTRLGNWTSSTIAGFDYHFQPYIDTLVHPVPGHSSRLGMLTFRAAGGGQLLDEGIERTVTPSLHANNPLLGTPQVIVADRLEAAGGETTYTGYLTWNNFDPRWRNLLVQTFRDRFAGRPEGEDLENVILDLRYNKHGSVEMAELMGSLLVGNVEGVAGKTFAEYTFNNSTYNRTVTFEAHPDGIAPKTVFILTSRHTAGAAELLINALRGLEDGEGNNIINLVVIGEVTQGLAGGMVKRTVPDREDPTREYSAWILSFRCKNDVGEGDYVWGLVPNSEVNELERGDNMKWLSTWEWKGVTGSTEDPLLKRAMDIVIGRQLMPTGVVGNAAKRSRTGYPREFCFPTDMTMDVN